MTDPETARLANALAAGDLMAVVPLLDRLEEMGDTLRWFQLNLSVGYLVRRSRGWHGKEGGATAWDVREGWRDLLNTAKSLFWRDLRPDVLGNVRFCAEAVREAVRAADEHIAAPYPIPPDGAPPEGIDLPDPHPPE